MKVDSRSKMKSFGYPILTVLIHIHTVRILYLGLTPMSSNRPNKKKVDAAFRFVCAEKEKKSKKPL